MNELEKQQHFSLQTTSDLKPDTSVVERRRDITEFESVQDLKAPKYKTLTEAIREFKFTKEISNDIMDRLTRTPTPTFGEKVEAGYDRAILQLKQTPDQVSNLLVRNAENLEFPNATKDQALQIAEASAYKMYLANKSLQERQAREGTSDSFIAGLTQAGISFTQWGLLNLVTGGTAGTALMGLQEAGSLSQSFVEKDIERGNFESAMEYKAPIKDIIAADTYGAVAARIEKGLGAEAAIGDMWREILKSKGKSAAVKAWGKEALKRGIGEGLEELLQGEAEWSAGVAVNKEDRNFYEGLMDSLISGVYGSIVGTVGGGLSQIGENGVARYYKARSELIEKMTSQGVDINTAEVLADKALTDTTGAIVEEIEGRNSLQTYFGEDWNKLVDGVEQAYISQGWEQRFPDKDVREFAEMNAKAMVAPVIELSNKTNMPLKQILDLANFRQNENALFIDMPNVDDSAALTEEINKREKEKERLKSMPATKATDTVKRLNEQIKILNLRLKNLESYNAIEKARMDSRKANLDNDLLASTRPEIMANLGGIRQAQRGESFVYVGNNQVPVRYVVKPMAEVQASHIAGEANPNYTLKELQNRTRRTVTDDAILQNRAANLKPEELAESPNTQYGAPVVNKNGEVISGNGRMEILRRAYELGNTNYKEMLDSLGYNTEGIERPVLVRETIDDLTPEQQVAIAEASNVSETSAFDHARQAMNDAKLLKKGISDPVTFADELPVSERQAYIRENGQYDLLALQRRFDDAVLAWIIGDTKTFDSLVLANRLNQKVIKGISMQGGNIVEFSKSNPALGIKKDLRYALVKSASIKTRGHFIPTVQQQDIEEGITFNADALLYAMTFSNNSSELSNFIGQYVQTHQSYIDGQKDSFLADSLPKLSKEDITNQVLLNNPLTASKFDKDGTCTDSNLKAVILNRIPVENVGYGTIKVEPEESQLFQEQISENIYGATNSNEEPIANPEKFNIFIEGSRVTDNDEPVSPTNHPKKIYRGDTRYFEEYEDQENAYEYDWGKGFYLSDNYEDVAENYQSRGADLTNRIDREAEQYAEDHDISYDEAREEVRKQYEQEDIIREFYLSMKDPVIIGGDKETFFDYTEEYNEETDEYEEPQGKLLDLIYGIENYLADIGADEYTQAITERLYEKAIDNGGLTASQIEDIVRGTEEANYLIDYESGAGEMLSSVFASIGFDGIIDHRAGTKFKNMNMDPDTTHYIVFNSEQAKSVDNKGEWGVSNKNFYYQFAGEKAQTAALDKLDEAKQLEANGVDNEEIRQQTGWFRGADNIWRFEISDEDAKFKDINKMKFEKSIDENGNEIYKTKLSDLIEHQKLFEAYPELKDINVIITEEEQEGDKEVLGFVDKDGSIHLYSKALKNQEKGMNTLLHEIQHKIQKIEGFSRGANISEIDKIVDLLGVAVSASEERERTEYFAKKIGKEKAKNLIHKEWLANKMLRESLGETGDFSEEALKAMDDFEKTYKEYGLSKEDMRKSYETPTKAKYRTALASQNYETYQRIYGEIEARNTTLRRYFSEELRKKISPERTQQTNEGKKITNAEAIVVFGDGTVMEYKPTILSQSKNINGYFDAELKTIVIGSNFNFGTLQHEFAHFFLKRVFDIYKTGAGTQEFNDWFSQLSSILDIKADQFALTTPQQEQFARMTESYLFNKAEFPEGAKPAMQMFFDWCPAEYNELLSIGWKDDKGIYHNSVFNKESLDFFNDMYSLVPELGDSPLVRTFTNETNRNGTIIPADSEQRKEREKLIGETPVETVTTETTQASINIQNTPDPEVEEAYKEAIETEQERKKTPIEKFTQYVRIGRGTNTREEMDELAQDYIKKHRENAERVAFGNPIPSGYEDETGLSLGYIENNTGIDRAVLILNLMNEYTPNSPEYNQLYHNFAIYRSYASKSAGLTNDVNTNYYLKGYVEINKALTQKAALVKYGKTDNAVNLWNRDIDKFISQNIDKVYNTEPESAERDKAIAQFIDDAKAMFGSDESVLLQEEIRIKKAKDKQAFIDWANRVVKQIAKGKMPPMDEAKLMDLSVKAQKASKFIDSNNVDEAVAASQDIRAWQDFVNQKGLPESFVDKIIGTYLPSAMLSSPSTHALNAVSNFFNNVAIRAATRLHYGSNVISGDVLEKEYNRLKAIYAESGHNLSEDNKPDDVSRLHGEHWQFKKPESALGYLSPMRLLGWSDFYFRAHTYVDTLARIASQDAKGDPKKALELFNEYKQMNSVNQRAKEARLQAIMTGHIAVFTNNGTLANISAGMRHYLDYINLVEIGKGGHKGLGTLIMPFAKVPANIVGMGIQAVSSPFKLLGKWTGLKKDWTIQDSIALTNFGLFSSIVGIYLMAGLDYEPPYEPPHKYDPNKPYDSIKIGGVWVSVESFGALANPLRFTFTMLDMISNGKKVEPSLVKAIEGLKNDVPFTSVEFDNDYMKRKPADWLVSATYNQLSKAVPAAVKKPIAWTNRALGLQIEQDSALKRKIARQYGLDGKQTTINDYLTYIYRGIKVDTK